jgi:hypothetical protein
MRASVCGGFERSTCAPAAHTDLHAVKRFGGSMMAALLACPAHATLAAGSGTLFCLIESKGASVLDASRSERISQLACMGWEVRV